MFCWARCDQANQWAEKGRTCALRQRNLVCFRTWSCTVWKKNTINQPRSYGAGLTPAGKQQAVPLIPRQDRVIRTKHEHAPNKKPRNQTAPGHLIVFFTDYPYRLTGKPSRSRKGSRVAFIVFSLIANTSRKCSCHPRFGQFSVFLAKTVASALIRTARNRSRSCRASVAAEPS